MGSAPFLLMRPSDSPTRGKPDSVRRASAEGLRTQVLARWSDPRLLVWTSREPDGNWMCHLDGPPELIREVVRAYGRTPERELTLVTPGSIVYRWVPRKL